MNKYETYLFDFDYTLVDSSAGIVMCFQIVLTRHGYKGITDACIKRTIGKTLEDSFSILTDTADASILSVYKKEYIAEANHLMTDNTFLFPETKKVLTELKSRKAKLGIISTKYRYTIMELLHRDFPGGFFDIVVGCEDVDVPKPSPEGLFKAMAQLNTTPESTLYAGDSIIDAQVAQAARVDFVGVLHGMTSRKELTAYPHAAVVEDLTALL